MFHKTSDQQNLYYEVQGNTNAPKTLVFLNGLSQATLAWSLITPVFKIDYKIILLDFIFQGQSDKQGDVRDFNQHAADVKGLLDELKIEKATLIGISYGSLVAQNFAVNYPNQVDKLILISSFASKTPYYEAIEFSWHRALDAGGYGLLLDVMLPSVLSEGYFQNPLIPIEMMKAARKEVNENTDALKKLMTATQQREDYREKLKLIKALTLVIHGEQDMLFPLHMGKTVADNISGSRFEMIEKAGHTLNLEAIPQTAKLILGFL